MPNALETIGTSAFCECTLLSNIIIPKSVKTIGDNPFYGCIKLNSIIVEDGNVVFNSENNCNAIIQDNILISGCLSTIIPYGITTIGKAAFLGLDIDNIIIPNSILSIRDFAFADCKKLQTINLPSSLEEIGKYAFAGCSKLSIIDSDIANPFPIDDTAFEKVYQTAKLYVPEGSTSLYQQTNGWKQFVNILEGEIITGNFEVDGVYYEVDANSNRGVIVVKHPDGYKGTVIVPSQVTYKDILFHVTGIGEKAFKDSSVEQVNLPSTITYIGSWAFSFSKIKTIEIPEGVSKIESYAFRNCSQLTMVQLPSTLTTIETNAFSSTAISEIQIHKFVSEIENNAFGSCKNLTSIMVEEGNEIYDSRNNCNAIIRKSDNVLIQGCKNSIVPSGVSGIGEYAFNGSLIEQLVLPSSLTYIGSWAFSFSKIKTIEIPEGVSKIESYAFNNCRQLTMVQLPSTLTTIETNAFSSTAISEIQIHKFVSEIENNAFGSCKNLTSIMVEEGNEIYDSRNNCNAIIRKSDNVLIQGCKNSIVPSGVSGIGEYAFNGTLIEQLVLPSSLTYIGSWAFSSSKIKTIEIPEGVSKIERYAFNNCSQLTMVQLPSTLTTIESSAFNSCSLLLDIVSHIEYPFPINEDVFYDYQKTIYTNAVLSVPEGKVEAYRNRASWNKFVHIQEIEPDPTPVIDNKTYVIHKRAGQADLQLAVTGEHIVVPETIEYDGKSYSVTRILDSAFVGSEMISLSIPKSIIYIGVDVIKDCYRLAAIDWNPSFKPSDEFVGNIVNPNLLFYATLEQNVPNGIRNVIVGELANSITLTDETYGNFYCPKAFTANSITYTHNYCLPTEKGLAQGWESIALPFDVQTVKTANGDVIKPVSVAGAGEKRFWLRELASSGMVEADSIKANIPYIISMPNWEGYQDFYNIEGDVVFSAADATIVPTVINPVSWDGRKFWPCFQKQKQKEGDGKFYVLNKIRLTYINSERIDPPGSMFCSMYSDNDYHFYVYPFEAYITYDSQSHARNITVAELCGETTAIDMVTTDFSYTQNGLLIIYAASDGKMNIHSMSGQLMRTVALKKGTNTVSGITRGVYIVNGQKVLVK